jgi:L-ascorbate metabolism protein UlaG (beta-lactamase superfamily)
VDKVKAAGLTNVTGLAQGEAFHFDGFEVIAERSVDGLGDDQAAWIIKAQDHTLIHCGDTLWHGYWWDIAKKYGPIDAAFLPVNGAIVHEEGMTPSNQPICMEPEQALTAAKLLNCKLFVPIHYGTFCNPPIYNETRTPLLRLTEHSENFEVKVLQNKEEFFL